jgi:hypothetical protein
VLARGGEYWNDRRVEPAPRDIAWPPLAQLRRGR